MRQHLIVYGVGGAVVFVLIAILGIYNVNQGFGVGCLISLLIPLVVGFLAARAGMKMGTEKKAMSQTGVEGGIAAGITAVVGGLVNTVIGYIQAQNQLNELGVSVSAAAPDLLSLILVGVIVIAIVYFVLGFLGGVVASGLSSA